MFRGMVIKLVVELIKLQEFAILQLQVIMKLELFCMSLDKNKSYVTG